MEDIVDDNCESIDKGCVVNTVPCSGDVAKRTETVNIEPSPSWTSSSCPTSQVKSDDRSDPVNSTSTLLLPSITVSIERMQLKDNADVTELAEKAADEVSGGSNVADEQSNKNTEAPETTINNNNNNDQHLQELDNEEEAKESAATATTTTTTIADPTERAPDADAIKMFVGQIPKEWSETECHELFAEFGEIHSLKVLREKETGKSRGCCFVTFFKRKAALAAQDALHNVRTLERMHNPIQMKPADSENRQERKIFIGMLSRKCNEDEVRSMFATFGTMEECLVLRDAGGNSRGNTLSVVVVTHFSIFLILLIS